MSKMKIGTVTEVVKGLTVESMDEQVSNVLTITFTNGAVLTARPVSDEADGLGIMVSVDADWDYGDEEEKSAMN